MAMDRNRRRLCLAAWVTAAALAAAGCGAMPESVAGMFSGKEMAGDGGEAPSAAGALPEEASDSAEGPEEGSNVKLTFALTGDLSKLPQEAQDQIEAINQGKPPAEALGMETLRGYYALISTHTVIGTDKDSGEETAGKGRLTLYVPNLLEHLADVSVLFYDHAADRWGVLTAEQINTEAKTLSVILPGSGTLTVIYRRQE